MRVAYITERDVNSSKMNGGINKDVRLLAVLKSFVNVDVFFSDTEIYHKYYYLLNNRNVNRGVVDSVNEGKYDLVIISAMIVSPFLLGYEKINGKKIFYFADSQYHERRQKLSLIYSMLTSLLSLKEARVLKKNYCAYLGRDEVSCIPDKLQEKCLLFPFGISTNKLSFDNNGKLIIVGQYGYKPNYRMLVNINNIAKHIKSEIYVYGQNIPDLDFKENVVVVGYAETLDEIYCGARALIYSVDYGVGVKNKVLEAMSYGIPTIGYQQAFTNLELVNDESCIVVEDDASLVDAANNLDLVKVSSNAYRLAREKYSQEVVKREIKDSIDYLLSS